MKSEVMQREEQQCHDVYQLFDGSSEENEVMSDENSKESSEAIPKKAKYNTRGSSNIALASIRHHTGLCEAAEIAISAWINECLISQKDSSLVIDPNKLRKVLPEEIVKDLNTDQSYAYHIAQAIKSGEVPQ
ncbi:Hypothetical predicted protein [Octopus vulgaris]|uniref:Uncharacterized protein n=1 Tax=Octopus vulgaris TaxID=6645 RepID=A0AA36BXQ9_OCTVU|nr:Hypothetical predicted protein [Octopus vulgaris]